MDAATEIRHLKLHDRSQLCGILQSQDSWKLLMAIIPKMLSKDTYKCDTTHSNPAKYRSEHFRLIEDFSIKTIKSCPEILFDEWGTSGRVRPALGHLKYLLEKAELFRAADYVAVNILKQKPPRRPKKGPSAQVVLRPEEDLETKRIGQILDEINYPSSAIEEMNSINRNLDYATKEKPIKIPQIIISESPDVDEVAAPAFTIPVVIQNERVKSGSDLIKFSRKTVSDSDNMEPSDLIEFSTKSESGVDGVIPQLSTLLDNSESSSSEIIINSNYDSTNTNSEGEIASEVNCPHLSSLLEGTEDSTFEANIPNISQLNASSSIEGGSNLPAFSQLTDSNSESGSNLPAFSQLTDSSTESGSNLPAFSQLTDSTSESGSNLPAANQLADSTGESGSNLPASSQLTYPTNASSSNLPAFSQIMENPESKTVTSKNSRSCSSPLPNLSLNTLLPHFTYLQLENATNTFEETPLTENGRFLGSGAFGKVYLAVGLFRKPVAVKKLLLENDNEVHVDDTVTKQFRNEVEVLSKYKHENLLSLLGYSCDGCTYCLLYEYIPGGALTDRLQKRELIWTERIYIAMGTAKAISYLHTAYSTPLIHRDVKSANILLDDTNKPKLCDFGLIKLSPTANTNTGTTIFGTSAYMAPEAFRGDISIKLDTFSFGVVLLELLTSLAPVDENREGVDLFTHVDGVCEDDITPLLDNSVGSWMANGINFSDELYVVARKCLDEKKRRPTMSTVSKELVELVEKSL